MNELNDIELTEHVIKAIEVKTAEEREKGDRFNRRILQNYQINDYMLNHPEATNGDTPMEKAKLALEHYVNREAFRRVAVERGLISESEAKS